MHSKINWSVLKKKNKKKCNKGIFFSISYMPMHDIFDCVQIEKFKKKKKKNKKKKKKQKAKKNQNVFTWLQAYFLGDMRVIWCNSLGDSHFQTNVIDNVENLLEYYLHISYFVFCTFTSCTHYT